MKILILAPAYHPQVGGAETYARVIATGLSALGEDVTVLTDGSRLEASSYGDTVEVRRLRDFSSALADPTKLLWEQMAFALLQDADSVLKQIGTPDVVFANSNDTALLARMIGDALHVPVVGNFHEQAPEAGALGRGRARLVYERLGLEAIIAGSEFYRDKAIAHGARPERVHLISHGVDTDTFTPNRSQSSANPEKPLHITLSGRLAPRKQQHLMVSVFERLVSERGIDARLTLAGRAHSSSMDYFDALARQIDASPARERITIRQDLSLPEMPAVYRESDIVVQPSTAEGLGLAVLEAMACAVPVVVSDTTGLQEIIRDIRDGILVDPVSEDDWLDALTHLAQDEPFRRRLGDNGRDLVENRFSEARMVRQTRSLLAAVAANWSTGASDQIRLIEG
jgi:glycosyltransferase involved in cell wall biosynthesis